MEWTKCADRKITSVLSAMLVLGFYCIFSIPAHAQVTGATLSGTVTDPSGAVVAGATVSARNAATGATREVTSDSAGLYTIPNLTPGDYEVKVSASGFSTSVQSNLALAVGQQQQLNIGLKVGQTSTTVQVTEAAPQIELTSSALTGQVESETVRELPLNGRDWTSLAALQPGVAKIETQMSYDTSARGNRGFGSELTVSGQRMTFNNYRIDGISVNDYAMAAPGNVLGVVLGVDAIQEFSVLTGGFPAEYGRAAGGVVNSISKSGTNSFHGDIYEFLRNSALDSNDYLDRAAGQKKPPFKRNQFGGSAGGPIIKDKTFIFGDYEGLRQSKGIPISSNVPSANARVGLLSGCAGGSGTFPNCSTVTLANPTGACAANSSKLDPNASVCVNNYSAALLPLWPLPNGSLSGDKGVYVSSGLQDVPENFYTARVDHKLGTNDTLFGTYLYDDTNYLQPDRLNDIFVHSHTTRTTVAIEESHTFGSAFVNAARIGYNRDHVVNQFTDKAGTTCNGCAASTALGTITGQTAPRLTVGSTITDVPGGLNSGSHYLHTWNSYQAYDDAFWTHGTHTIKFGAGVERMLYNFEAFQNPGGRWKNFGSLANFLQGKFKNSNPNPPGGTVGHFEAGLPQAVSPREFRQTLFETYVQDDWKFKPNLTLNVGVRYEMTTVLNDSQGKITSLVSIFEANPNPTLPDTNVRCQKSFDAAAAFGVIPQAGTACGSTGAYYSNPTLRNVEPRVGFAWDPFKNGKTSVRGSFGIYDILPFGGYFILQENQSAPFMIFKSTNSALDGAQAGGFGAQNGQSILSNPAAKAPLAISTIEPNPHRSYVEQWNLNVQRQLMADTTLTVGYVGSRGVHLLQRGDDGNMTLPVKTPYGYEFPGLNGTQVNQAYSVIRYIYWGTDSSYNGLNVNLDKRFSHGVQFQVAYTFAKGLDDNSQTIAGDSLGNGLNSPWWFLPKYFKGPSDFNVTHNLSVNALYDIPTPKSWTGVTNTALGGWELGGIISVNSGSPTTPIITGDPLNLGNGGADQFGLPNYVPGQDPLNHSFAGSLAGAPSYFNLNAFVVPSVPTSALGTLPFPCDSATFSGAVVPAGQTPCANLAGTVGRNSITGPRFFDLDFSVLKNFSVPRISETFKIQFRAEMFNITNHTNFVPPQPDSGDGGADVFNTDGSAICTGPTDKAGNCLLPLGGQISRFAHESREIQFGLKVLW